MRKRQISAAPSSTIALMVVGIGLFLHSGCDRNQGTGQSSARERKPNNTQMAAEDGDEHTSDAAPVQNQKSAFDPIESIGRSFDAEYWRSRFTAAAQSSSGEGELNYTYRGKAKDPFMAITIRTKQGKVVAIDVTLNRTDGKEIKSNILHDFHRFGVRKSHLLAPNLDEVEITFEEFVKEGSDVRLLVARQEPVRMVIFDTKLVSTDDVLPTTKNLAPDLLDRARNTLERQKTRWNTEQ